MKRFATVFFPLERLITKVHGSKINALNNARRKLCCNLYHRFKALSLSSDHISVAIDFPHGKILP